MAGALAARLRLVAAAVAVVLVGGAAAACGGGDPGVRVTSPAFDDGDLIPERFSCLGENVPPPLAWTGVPEDAVEVAVLVTDPEAPDGTFFHWVVLRLPAETDRLTDGALPEGAVVAPGSSENPTYIGMCPPQGEEHEYRFTVHALDEPMPKDAAGLAPDEVKDRVAERSIAAGTLTGRFRG